MMKRTLVAMAVAAFVGAPSIAAAQSSAAEETGNMIPLIAVSEIAKQGVKDSAGVIDGELLYIVIDATGEALFAAFGNGDTLASDPAPELTLVPWSKMTVEQSDGMPMVRVAADGVQNLPKIAYRDLWQLTQPTRIDAIYEAYAIPEQERATVEPGGEPLSLVGSGTIVTLVEPAAELADEYTGATVEMTDGSRLGTVEDLMLDPSAGHVAFAVISTAGAAEADTGWAPVPFTALTWEPESNSYVVAKDPSQLGQTPEIVVGEQLPDSVDRTELGSLFEAFGQTPYWQG